MQVAFLYYEPNEKSGRKTCLFHGDAAKIRSFEAEQAQAHKTTIFSGVSMTAPQHVHSLKLSQGEKVSIFVKTTQGCFFLN